MANTNPLIVTSYRFLISAILLGGYLILKKSQIWSNLKYGLALSFLVFIIYVAQAVGLQFTSAANSGFITGLFVAFVPFFSWIVYKKKPELNKFLAVFVAVVGLWFLTGGFGQLNFGDVITLLTAVAYGLHVLLLGLFVRKIDPVILAFQQFLFTGLFCLIVALFTHASFAIPTNNSLLIVFYLAIIPTLSALVIQAFSQRYVAEIKAAVIMSFEPVFAAIFAWTIGGEIFSIQKALGGLLIFFAMIISEFKFKKL